MRRVRTRTVGSIEALPVDAILAVMPGFVALLDSDGTILDVGGGTAAPGRPDADLIGFRLHDFLPVTVADALVGALRRALASGQPVTSRYAVTDDEPDARYRTATINPTGDGRALMHVHDVTLDHHDRLTGLPDRSSLHAELDLAIVDGTAANPAVLLVDIDRFKRLNDSLGYSRGDEAIVSVADRIAEVVGGTATIGHVGGDEFVVALHRVVDAAEALELATLVRMAIARPLPLGTGTVHLTASIGVALAEGPRSADALLRDADAALHHAKKSGRNRQVLFDSSLRGERVDRVELEAALHTAIAEGELCLHYQPVIDLATGSTVGVEALVRWDRPGHGLVSPDAFVPVAEQAGIINELGAFVLRHAVRDARLWHEHTGLNVAVNVSASQLTDPGLADSVLDALAESGLPAEALSLELTETAYSSASDAAVTALQLVRDRGVRVALDDFGSGYSSLDRVRRFPVDVIKIDRESVIALPKGARDQTIVRAMIELAHALGVPVVAEGVEEIAEHDALVELGCDQAQGFLYARPLPADELTARLGITPSTTSTSGASAR